jgi:hypothetical protein
MLLDYGQVISPMTQVPQSLPNSETFGAGGGRAKKTPPKARSRPSQTNGADKRPPKRAKVAGPSTVIQVDASSPLGSDSDYMMD